MRAARILICGVALILGTLGVTGEADAQFFGGGFGSWGGYWNQPAFGVGGSLYGADYIHVPPYYAIHPPVYYSGRVYRPYGDSPYAYLPERYRSSGGYDSQVRTVVPQPQMILNPFMQGVSPASKSDSAAAAPLNNPHVRPAEKTNSKKEGNPSPTPKLDNKANATPGAKLPWSIAPSPKIVVNPYIDGPLGGDAGAVVSVAEIVATES